MESITGLFRWDQIITLLLTSAEISGVLSAFLNQRKSKIDREANIIQEKLSLYSTLIDKTNRLLEIGSVFSSSNNMRYSVIG